MTRYRDFRFDRWVVLMLVFALLGVLLAPIGAEARVDYSSDAGTMEGDPIDGLGSDGSGSSGGGDLDDGDLKLVGPGWSPVFVCPAFVFVPNTLGYEKSISWTSDFIREYGAATGRYK